MESKNIAMMLSRVLNTEILKTAGRAARDKAGFTFVPAVGVYSDLSVGFGGGFEIYMDKTRYKLCINPRLVTDETVIAMQATLDSVGRVDYKYYPKYKNKHVFSFRFSRAVGKEQSRIQAENACTVTCIALVRGLCGYTATAGEAAVAPILQIEAA